jgi:hypothetical protein
MPLWFVTSSIFSNLLSYFGIYLSHDLTQTFCFCLLVWATLQFCFPEKTIQSSSYQFKGDVASQCWRYHNFVFTGVSGERYYGHCLRFSTHHLSSASTTNTSNTSSATTNNANPNVRSPRDRTTSPIESKSDIEMFLDSCYFDASLEESFTNTTPEDVDNTMVFTISNQPKIGRGVAIGVRGAPPITEPKRPTNASQEQLSKSQSDYTLDAAVCILSSTPFFNTIRTWLVHTWKEALVRPQHKYYHLQLSFSFSFTIIISFIFLID